jgi:chitin synthase
MSDAEIGRSTSLRRNLSMASQKNDGKPRRQRSLVRPERERNDPNNRLYHYRQRVSNQMGEENDIAPSTTGNYPMAAPPPHNPTLPPSQRPLERKPTKREVLLRRGKSILGREEKHDDTTDGAIDYDIKKKKGCADFSLWMTYCRILTCCIPGPLLRCAGKKKID